MREGRTEPGTAEIEGHLVDGLRGPAKDLLLQILLYKATFTGRSFRSLAARETPEVRDALLAMGAETVAEAAAAATLMREWDRSHAAGEGIEDVARETRTRLLQDLVALKEGMTETGLAAAMRAPTAGLRDRLMRIVDVDRRHGDQLRALMGAAQTRDHLARIGSPDAPDSLGARERREGGTSLGGTIRLALEEVRRRGSEPTRLVVAPEGARHLRDEGAIAPDGKVLGVWLDVDMGWRGEAFAVETEDRVGYAELLSLHRRPG
ncbi:MAG TPA: hypothetical protein VHH36_02125 [Candidatus Thermoplasmatota archaeon]|nr:hypothetical protein [Candidatus Thermoplasmatota archaeon]